MSFIIYNKKSTVLITGKYENPASFKTIPAAKAHLTRELKKGNIESREDYAIEDYTIFSTLIEKELPVRNLLSGKIVMEKVNTPRSCSVGSELYFSM